MGKPRLSPRLQKERDFVEQFLGSSVICDRCHTTLDGFAQDCTADLSDACPGVLMIEDAKEEFARLHPRNQ